MERSRNSRGTFDARLCAFTIVNTTENEYIKFHWIFERKKLNDDIQRPCKFKIQISINLLKYVIFFINFKNKKPTLNVEKDKYLFYAKL